MDEAGRGPLAGPVCAAAVILPQDIEIPGPERLQEAHGEAARGAVRRNNGDAVAYGIAFASVEEIEELNILGATYLAMNRAIAALGRDIDLALIDGNRSEGIEYPSRTVVKGDSRCASIAAASILAKVTRDRLYGELDGEYPGYGFARHKGYGTRAHYAAIRALGLCPEHRPSFLRKLH